MNGRIYIMVYINIILVVVFQKQDFCQKLNESFPVFSCGKMRKIIVPNRTFFFQSGK